MVGESATEQSDQITVEVAYALPDKQALLSITVDKDCTALDAVKLSGMADNYPEINIEELQLGIFSKSCTHDQTLQAGDRVEIYRPLIADPKEVRKRRAAEMAAKKATQKAAQKATK